VNDDQQEVENQVRHALAYLMAEGLVVEEGGLYRMKTTEEHERELELLLND
jgi:hypothetical protein